MEPFYFDPALYYDPFHDLNLDSSFTGPSHPSTITELPSPPSSVQFTSRNRTRIRASKACLACRSRHLKCDASDPTCTRCQTDSKSCVYTKSRRGGSSRLQKQVTPSQADDHPYISLETSRSTLPLPRSGDLDFPAFESQKTAEDANLISEELISFYYEYFHNAHPIALPRKFLEKRMQSDPASLRLVLAVMEYVGSVYHPTACSQTYLEVAQAALSTSLVANSPNLGFTVQALILLALAMHCSDEWGISRQYHNLALDIALEIEMHRAPFAQQHGEGDSVLEESWRRTWWTLQWVDVVYASTSYAESHRLKGIGEEVGLPCEDAEYESGQIPVKQQTFQDYDNREFLDSASNHTFSSFTYFIDTSRIFSEILPIIHCKDTSRRPNDDQIAMADAKFVNWFLYLPKRKQGIMRNGNVDELIFTAILTINTQKLLLYRPHSNLNYSPIEQASRCTPPPPQNTTAQALVLHTNKCLEALSSSIPLFTLPVSHEHHSPLSFCSLALATMAQASACHNIFQKDTSEFIISRDRIRMGLGVLRSGARFWTLQQRSVSQVAGVAQGLLEI